MAAEAVAGVAVAILAAVGAAEAVGAAAEDILVLLLATCVAIAIIGIRATECRDTECR